MAPKKLPTAKMSSSYPKAEIIGGMCSVGPTKLQGSIKMKKKAEEKEGEEFEFSVIVGSLISFSNVILS